MKLRALHFLATPISLASVILVAVSCIALGVIVGLLLGLGV